MGAKRNAGTDEPLLWAAPGLRLFAPSGLQNAFTSAANYRQKGPTGAQRLRSIMLRWPEGGMRAFRVREIFETLELAGNSNRGGQCNLICRRF